MGGLEEATIRAITQLGHPLEPAPELPGDAQGANRPGAPEGQRVWVSKGFKRGKGLV